MKKLFIPIAVALAILAGQVVTEVSAQTPAVAIPTATPAETATPTPEETSAGCWDCAGSTMTEAEVVAAVCSSAFLEEHPQMLDECFPDKWEWVCFPLPPDGSGTCEMYRRDLDPLGIFATP